MEKLPIVFPRLEKTPHCFSLSRLLVLLLLFDLFIASFKKSLFLAFEMLLSCKMGAFKCLKGLKAEKKIFKGFKSLS